MKERYCIVDGCDRKLRTGNKYCHIHRGFANLPKEPELEVKEETKKVFSDTGALIMTTIIMGFIISIIGFMAGGIPMGICFIVITIILIWVIYKLDDIKEKKKHSHFNQRMQD